MTWKIFFGDCQDLLDCCRTTVRFQRVSLERERRWRLEEEGKDDEVGITIKLVRRWLIFTEELSRLTNRCRTTVKKMEVRLQYVSLGTTKDSVDRGGCCCTASQRCWPIFKELVESLGDDRTRKTSRLTRLASYDEVWRELPKVERRKVWRCLEEDSKDDQVGSWKE